MLNRSFGRSSSNSFGCLAPVAALVIIGIALFVFKDRFPGATEAAQLVTPPPAVEPPATATATVEPTATENYQATASSLSITAQVAQMTAEEQTRQQKALFELQKHEAELSALLNESNATIEISKTLAIQALEAQIEIDKVELQKAINEEKERHYREMVKWIIIIPVILLAVLVFGVYLLLYPPRPVEQYEDEQDEETQPAIPVNGGFAGIDIEDFFTKKPDARPWFKELCRLAARDEYFLSSHWRNQPKGKIEEAHRAQLAIREFFLEWKLCEILPGDKWHLVGDGKQWAEAWSK